MAKVYLSPSQQGSNKYAAGNTTERVQCEKIAAACKAALDRCGVDCILEPSVDVTQRVLNANAMGVDLYVPIHTNACDRKTSGTRMFYYDTKSAGYKAVRAIFPYLDSVCPGTSSKWTAKPTLYEIKNPEAPAAYCECDFHDVPSVAEFIIAHTTEIGEAIAHGICDFFGVEYKPEPEPEPEPEYIYRVQVGAYSVRSNAEKMLGKIKAAGFNGYIKKEVR